MTPADVDNKVLLCEADDLALNNGDPISPWPDTSGAGHNLATAVPVERPICRTDAWTGHKVAAFRKSGTDIGHKLAVAFALPQPTSLMLAMVQRGFPNNPSAMGLVDGITDFSNYLAIAQASLGANRPSAYAGVDAQFYLSGRPMDLNVATVLTAVFNGASSLLEHDGVDFHGPRNAGATAAGGITLGANALAAVGVYSEFASMDVFGLLVCSDVWTRAERLGLLDYFVRKYQLDLALTTAGLRRAARAHR